MSLRRVVKEDCIVLPYVFDAQNRHNETRKVNTIGIVEYCNWISQYRYYIARVAEERGLEGDSKHVEDKMQTAEKS